MVRYYRDERLGGVNALHARFVRHRYPRHAHEYAVVALVERGPASYWYRGAQHTAPADHVFVINAGAPHAGDPVLADGYVYRALYPTSAFLSRLARDLAVGSETVHFKGAVIPGPASERGALGVS
jgi:AraC-like protein